MKDRRDGDIPGALSVRAQPVRDDSDYSDGDREHFARLSEFPSSRDAISGRGRATVLAAEEPAVEYTEHDARTFESLMKNIGTAPRARGISASSRTARSQHPYTDRDMQLFSMLLPADECFESGGRVSEPADPPDEPVEPESYSASDLAAFRRIMPSTVSESSTPPEENIADSRPPDRDVGPIRIVEFGERHTRPRHRERTGNVNVKIRYFD